MEMRPTTTQAGRTSAGPVGRGRLCSSGSAGFDNEQYLAEQSNAILQRVKATDGKLYLEFGGKLVFDQHAARVLPGHDPNVKMRLLQRLAADAEIILCIYAGHIERRKVRADFGITYDSDAFKLIDGIRAWGLDVSAVVITRFEGQAGAAAFQTKLQRRGICVVTHPRIKGYPADVDLIVSEHGYDANVFIESHKPLVVVTGPEPNSGKMATCLSQVYHEHRRGHKAGYAKLETSPIWNLPLRHPVNVAYEAATADIRDFNLIDPFHLEACGQTAVNYNRDVECFPVLRAILERITGGRGAYRSPTDMGVNQAAFAIVDDDLVRRAAAQEVVRRHFRYACEYAMGLAERQTVQRVEMLMKELNVTAEDRKVVQACRPRRGGRRKGQRERPGRCGHRDAGRVDGHRCQFAPAARRQQPRAQRPQMPSGRSPRSCTCCLPASSSRSPTSSRRSSAAA